MSALRRDLQARSEGGAGLAELLSYLKRRSRRLGPGRRLSDEQLDELSLYCWALQAGNPKGLLWGRARELWGGSRTGPPRAGQGSSRRPRRRATG
jgi:hypothetical protein